LVISSTKRTIREKEGNEEDGFCSKRCMTRSGWVEKALGEEAVWLRGEKGELELLEEIEERRASGSALDRRAVREDSPITEPTALQVEARRPTPISTSETAAGTLPFSSRPASSVSTQPPKQVSDAMDNLIIHERDTPSTVPEPPSVSTPSMTTQLAAKLPSPLPATTRRDVPSQVYSAFGVPDPTRPAPSSLLAPTSLTTTLLSASRQMGPIPQLSPDSDDEGDAERRRGWEKAMGWGEVDEERRALFDEAMLVREIMQDEEVDGGGYR